MTEDEKVLSEAKTRWDITEDMLHDERVLQLEDIKFSIGDSDNGYQWPEEVIQDRIASKRPALTMNKLPQFINQVVNDARANRPQIKVRPVDNGADKDAAEIFQGIIKNIESTSNADLAYDTSVEYSARCGMGYFRVVTDYIDDLSFDQDIIIKRVPDPLSVRLDPSFTEPDGSDARWGFIEDRIPKDEFIATYPDADMSQWDQSDHGTWYTDGYMRICEYFRIKEMPATLNLLSDGSTQYGDEELPEGVTVVRSRKGKKREVEWFKITSSHVLEKTIIKTSWIPIFPVIGNEVYIEGKPHRSGMVRNAKDPQRQYNYWASSETEMVALAPRAPFIGYAGQFKDPKWETANTKNHAFLEAEPMDIDGNQAPLPQRSSFAGVPAGIVNAKAGSNQDIRETVGMYNASVGAPSSETSGRAILAKQKEGDTGTFHYTDNQARTIRHLGRVLLEMIPNYYDTERVARILGEDGEGEEVKIDPEMPQAMRKEKNERNEIKVIFNPNVGKYDVSVSVGPSYASRRMEAAENMVELARVVPAIANIAPDLITRNMDFEGADEIADRLKASLPPEIVGNDGEEPIPPQVKAMIQQVQQAAQVVEMKTQELLQKEQEIGASEVEIKAEMQSLDAKKAVFDANVKAAKLEIQNMMLKSQQGDQDGTVQALQQYVQELEQMVERLSVALEAIPEPPQEPLPTEPATAGIFSPNESQEVPQ